MKTQNMNRDWIATARTFNQALPNLQRYTGAIKGTPCYQHGKITKLNAWLDARAAEAAGGDPLASLADSILYSDSFNDLPLLNAVTTAVAVDPDPRLEAEAVARGWEIRSLRGA